MEQFLLCLLSQALATEAASCAVWDFLAGSEGGGKG